MLVIVFTHLIRSIYRYRHNQAVLNSEIALTKQNLLFSGFSESPKFTPVVAGVGTTTSLSCLYNGDRTNSVKWLMNITSEIFERIRYLL